MQYFILADPEKCIGCRTCALACSFEHEELFIPVLSRITPLWIQEAGRFVPFTCQQCSEPLCAAACAPAFMPVPSAFLQSILQNTVCSNAICAADPPGVWRNVHGMP
jgi:carbon-monoxide dehydrogenase iron sulfur subunit